MISLVRYAVVIESNSKSVDRFLLFISKLAASLYTVELPLVQCIPDHDDDDEEDKDEDEVDYDYDGTFLHKLLNQLLEWSELKTKGIRYRSVQLIRDITQNLEGGVEIDEHLYDNIIIKLKQRIHDVSPSIRSMAAMSIQKLQSNDKNVTQVLIDALNTDPSDKVRDTVVNTVFIYTKDIPEITKRVRDKNPTIRASTYRFFANKVKFAMLDVPTRIRLLSGIQDREDRVKKSCFEMIKSWLDHLGSDMEKLLKELDCSNNETVCLEVLGLLFTNNIMPSRTFSVTDILTNESALCWRAYINHLKTNVQDHSEANVDDQAIPEALPLLGSLSNYEFDDFVFIQICHIFNYLDIFDPSTRNAITLYFRNKMLSLLISIPVKKAMLSTLRTLFKGRTDFKEYLFPILSELQDPLEGTQIGASSMEDSEEKVRLMHALAILADIFEFSDFSTDIHGFIYELTHLLANTEDNDIIGLGIKCIGLFCVVDDYKDPLYTALLPSLLHCLDNDNLQIRISAMTACFDAILSKPNDMTKDFCQDFVGHLQQRVLYIDDCDLDILHVAIEGLCKLFYNDNWNNQEDFNRLVSLYFITPDEQSSYYRTVQVLNSFIPRYSLQSKSKMTMLLNSFQATLEYYLVQHRHNTNNNIIQIIVVFYLKTVHLAPATQKDYITSVVKDILYELSMLITCYTSYGSVLQLCSCLKLFDQPNNTLDDGNLRIKYLLNKSKDISTCKSSSKLLSKFIDHQFKDVDLKDMSSDQATEIDTAIDDRCKHLAVIGAKHHKSTNKSKSPTKKAATNKRVSPNKRKHVDEEEEEEDEEEQSVDESVDEGSDEPEVLPTTPKKTPEKRTPVKRTPEKTPEKMIKLHHEGLSYDVDNSIDKTKIKATQSPSYASKVGLNSQPGGGLKRQDSSQCRMM
ncbi:hypothetical protein SAMD00019534_086090 [Acytostelium subglobosum LB1]|uniref:hypothetical protein n=1 Tax=Acytostelium subglobosum LB1 TaxID=1410327 RepID=UPI000644EB3E|nr:hypothetical protein SAMD00019534_086090 [Acytostelium subglobosum LB1]GAM25434.1 hypothetical protein SAMD00019534_086090 [Acytostelium subglobosum LB1]|eukprot:XP_012751420.1 hypothetical protein SAMD00019534_086090 [Acytostelium subglobosum LB1]